MSSIRPRTLDQAATLAVAEKHSLVLEVEQFDPAKGDLGTLMDLLEVLPKAGFSAVDLLDPTVQALTLLTEWTTSAEEAGIVDSLFFRESDLGLPIGNNVSYLATQRIVEEVGYDVSGQSVLLMADPISGQGAIAALTRLGASQVRIVEGGPGTHPEAAATEDTVWRLNFMHGGDGVENAGGTRQDPTADDTLGGLFWAERLRQIVQLSDGPDLPFSFSQELAEAEATMDGE